MAILSGVHAEYDPELLDTSLPAHAALLPQLRTTEPARAALFRSLLRRLGLKTADVVREPPPVTHVALVAAGLAPTHPYSAEIASLFTEAVVGVSALETGDASGPSAFAAPTTRVTQGSPNPNAPPVFSPAFRFASGLSPPFGSPPPFHSPPHRPVVADTPPAREQPR